MGNVIHVHNDRWQWQRGPTEPTPEQRRQQALHWIRTIRADLHKPPDQHTAAS